MGLITIITASAEYLYHMNIKTPHWWGYIFQRPEQHRIHHRQGVHYYNFSDLPIWDMCFGTFKNPKEVNISCGFKDNRENQLWKILSGKNVNGGKSCE